MQFPNKSIVISGFLILLFQGCATSKTKPNLPAEDLFKLACSPGQDVKNVKGVVWFKAKSKEFTGQFYANIVAIAPDQLKMEITNAFGGTEALVTVNKNDYRVQRGAKTIEHIKSRSSSVGGLPLRWAAELFLGQIPCPRIALDVKMSVGKDGELVVVVPALFKSGEQKFVYEFQEKNGRFWPSALHWTQELPKNQPERSHIPLRIDFIFDDPEDKTLSPKKWEVDSDEGSVKVRWRDRNI